MIDSGIEVNEFKGIDKSEVTSESSGTENEMKEKESRKLEFATPINVFILAGYSFFLHFFSELVSASYLLRYQVPCLLNPDYDSVTDNISTITNAISLILIGIYGDKLKSRFGRRKPIICCGGIVIIIAGYLAYNPPSSMCTEALLNPLHQKALFYWYFFTYIIFNFVATFMAIVVQSWMFESSPSSFEYMLMQFPGTTMPMYLAYFLSIQFQIQQVLSDTCF